ncbi:MAG: VanZ family protein [Clostridiales bacterium]|nr:VanZ family protein [Clostridiales bacterium]
MRASGRNSPSTRILLGMLMAVYTAAIVYFMFFGFGRPEAGSAGREYRPLLVPTGIPLWFPRRLSQINSVNWIFSLGNLLAFVPFGMFAPAVFRARYFKFIFVFLLSILSLETLQMVTHLGRFDVHDIIVNSLGATIGYFSYRIGSKAGTAWKRATGMLFLVLLFSLLLMVFAEYFNKMVAGGL